MVERKEKTPSVFKPPTLDEVREYCRERGKGVDPEKWFDFYASKGWLVGKSPMRDWRAAARNWAARDAAESAPAKSEMSSFDIEDAFNAALAKTYGGDA